MRLGKLYKGSVNTSLTAKMMPLDFDEDVFLAEGADKSSEDFIRVIVATDVRRLLI